MESSRKDLAHRPFDATFPGFEMLRQSADELRAAGLEFLPVYMPELSYSREMYADSDFYAGLVEYLTQIGYLDCSAILPYNRFYDFHHLTYEGSREMSVVLARTLFAAYGDGDASGCRLHGWPHEESP